MGRIVRRFAPVGYLLGGIVSYGHAYHAIGDATWHVEQRATGAILVAAAWPLYVSVTLQAKRKMHPGNTL